MNLNKIKDKLTYHNLLNRITDSIESDAEALIKERKDQTSQKKRSQSSSPLFLQDTENIKSLAPFHWFPSKIP